VPDAIVRAADEVEMVDMAAEALRERMAHGNIYPAEQIQAALASYFRAANLSALRELALLWLAAKLAEYPQHYRADHQIHDAQEACERVAVALTGRPDGETLIRRAARIAARSGGDLVAVHVARSGGPAGACPAALTAQRRLVGSIGGTFHQVTDDNIPAALLRVAQAENATQLVLGASHNSWLSALLPGTGIKSRVIRGSDGIDVHIVIRRGVQDGAVRRSQQKGIPVMFKSTSTSLILLGILAIIAGILALTG
jgi:two-component system sensor histidine kinase KdpD